MRARLVSSEVPSGANTEPSLPPSVIGVDAIERGIHAAITEFDTADHRVIEGLKMCGDPFIDKVIADHSRDNLASGN